MHGGGEKSEKKMFHAITRKVFDANFFIFVSHSNSYRKEFRTTIKAKNRPETRATYSLRHIGEPTRRREQRFSL